MLTLLSLMLLSAPLDCGANLSLDATPAGVSIRSGARAATFPAPAGFSPVRCTWAPAHGLLLAASDTA
ncbi:hypothetical protein KKD52_07675, partial [Myxococcota bacterium]|nr:hypothetical protein [Myxococcota bacterium]